MKAKWIIITVFLAIVSAYFYKCEYQYYKKFNLVKDEFNKIQGVQIIELTIGNHDVTAEEIHGKIIVGDKTEIGFGSSIYPRCFYEETPVRINEYKEWKFYSLECQGTETNQYDWWQGTVDIGLNGEFNAISNKPIRNIKEAILNHQELGLIVDKIPEYPKFGVINKMRKNFRSTKFIYKYKKTLNEIPKIQNMNCDSLLQNSIILNRKNNYTQQGV